MTSAGVARAQANDRSSPLGGRSALMGNTGVALGRDGAAPFLNPATVVGIDDRSLAFSVNLLALQVNHFDDFHQPSTVDPRFGTVSLSHNSVSSTRVTAIPSTLCLFVSFSALSGGEERPEGDPTPWKGGRQKLAICLATLEGEDLLVPALGVHAATPAGVSAQDVSLTRKWNRAQFGPSYSAQLNERLALGASLHGAFTTLSFNQDASSITSMTDGTAAHSTLGAAGSGYSVDLTAILGAAYAIGPVTLGASVQVPSLHLFGAYSATQHQSFDAPSGSDATVTSGSGNFRASPPFRVAAGIGAALRGVTLEADAAFDFGDRDALASSMHVDSAATTNGALSTSTSRETFSARTLPTFNVAVGGEFFVAPGLSVLGGGWTNLSAFPPLKPLPAPSLGNLVQARTHQVGISLGLGSYGDGGELLLGTQLGYGWGEAVVPNLYSVPNDWNVVGSSKFSALFILAGSTNLRSIKRAIVGVGKALAPSSNEPQPPAPSP
ncbi:MAG TPA: hypothetical protein VGQ57_00685 [Polyangiaceae bacterium]|nr:hypothetical protein [Polyangiaceae bacterium]